MPTEEEVRLTDVTNSLIQDFLRLDEKVENLNLRVRRLEAATGIGSMPPVSEQP